jgi:hypothetical protein
MSEIDYIQLTCQMTSIATKAQGSRDHSEIHLAIFPENATIEDLNEIIKVIEYCPIVSTQERPNGWGNERAIIHWKANTGYVQLFWEDMSSEPWPLIEQIMKQLLLQSLRIEAEKLM